MCSHVQTKANVTTQVDGLAKAPTVSPNYVLSQLHAIENGFEAIRSALSPASASAPAQEDGEGGKVWSGPEDRFGEVMSEFLATVQPRVVGLYDRLAATHSRARQLAAYYGFDYRNGDGVLRGLCTDSVLCLH